MWYKHLMNLANCRMNTWEQDLARLYEILKDGSTLLSVHLLGVVLTCRTPIHQLQCSTWKSKTCRRALLLERHCQSPHSCASYIIRSIRSMWLLLIATVLFFVEASWEAKCGPRVRDLARRQPAFGWFGFSNHRACGKEDENTATSRTHIHRWVDSR